jgi:hypothetical protein
MLQLDRFSESILFQCDRCRHVGELFTDVVEDEGLFHCWRCLGEMKNGGDHNREKKVEKYAVP